jgi:hypothetical protein
VQVPQSQARPELGLVAAVLGRDVEHVQYQGEGNWIFDYPKRRQWHQTIVAYFDWKLNGDSGWWDALYPE